MQISRVHDLMAKGLDYRSLRQDLVSSNIANVDTPFYRARDVDFEEALANESAELFPRPRAELELAVTDPGHLRPPKTSGTKATIFFRDGHLARNDGNTVDLDVETTEMAKNTVMYNALVAALKKDSMIFRGVLDASAKI